MDQSRQLLYTRSAKGSLVVFDLGKDGQKLVQVASVTQDQVVQRAMQCTRCGAERSEPVDGWTGRREHIHSHTHIHAHTHTHTHTTHTHTQHTHTHTHMRAHTHTHEEWVC